MLHPRTSPHETKSLFDADKRLLFVLLCAFSVLLLLIKKTFIENETAAFEFILDRPEGAILQTINGLQFLTLPLIYLWKLTLIALVLWIGCFIIGYRVNFNLCWGIALVAEFVFILPEILKIGWFLFIKTEPTLQEIRTFYPFSLLNLLDSQTIPNRWIYPLKSLNVFEVGYWFILYKGLLEHIKRAPKFIIIVLATSYIPIFLLWLIFYAIVYK